MVPVGTFGAPLADVFTVSTKPGLLSHFNLNNLCSLVLAIDLQDPANAELHSLTSVDNDYQFTIGGAFEDDFFIGNTVYYPCMLAYVNEFSGVLTTPSLEDTTLIFEEYF